MIVLAFTKLHPLIPIRHVALIHGDQVIESSGFRTHGLPAGVRMRSLFDFMDQHPDMELRYFEHPDPDAAFELAKTYVGAKYDYGWYLRFFGFGAGWEDPTKWVCQEICAHVLEATGKAIVDTTLPFVTPDYLYAASFGDEYAGL